MSAAKKKQPAAPSSGTAYVTPSPAERQAEFLRRIQKPMVTSEDVRDVAVAFDMEALHMDLDAARARTLAPPGRKNGSTNRRTDEARAYIRELLEQNPRKSPTWLYEHKVKNKKTIIGKMSSKTFGNHVRALRKK